MQDASSRASLRHLLEVARLSAHQQNRRFVAYLLSLAITELDMSAHSNSNSKAA